MRAIGIGVRHYLAQHASSGMTQVSASATLMSWGLRTLLWSVVLLAILMVRPYGLFGTPEIRKV